MATEDMPPPLEDMTATIEQARKLRGLRLGKQEHSVGTHASIGAKRGKTSTEQSSAGTAPVSHNNDTQPNTASTPVSHSNDMQPNTASTAVSHNNDTQPNTASTEKVNSAKSTPCEKSGSGDFGGMKRGFLFGGSKSGVQKSKTVPKKSQRENGHADTSQHTDPMPFIKPQTQDKDSGLKLDEVQKAMESTKGFLQDKEWVTDDLLEKVQSNKTLSKRLGDPGFMQAVKEFQTNPKAAMVKYQSNPEMHQFLKEFCGILGEHFTALGDKHDSQNPSQAQNPVNTAHTGPKITELTDEDTLHSARSQDSSVPVDTHVQQILADPVNKEILMDPKIQQLIENLRSSPEKAQRMLREGDSDFKQKIDRLISLGLLKFQA